MFNWRALKCIAKVLQNVANAHDCSTNKPIHINNIRGYFAKSAYPYPGGVDFVVFGPQNNG